MNAADAKLWLSDFDAFVGRLDSASVAVVQSMCMLGRGKLDALEARALAGEIGTDGDTRRAERLATQGGKRSKSAARAAAKRGKAVAENKGLADSMASGDLSTEQVDTIAAAMDADASAATDQELIDKVAGSSVSEGRKAARDWQARKTDKSAADSEYERQRKQRRAFRYDNKTKGLAAFTVEGDHATVNELWNLVRQRERALREADGGRDLAFDKHPRTYEQRLFDAVADLVRGKAGGLGGRPSIVITVPVDGSVATAAGGEPVSDTVVRDALSRAKVSVALVDKITAEPLAWGRLKRNATTQQFIALVVRDQGCGLCGGSWIGCEAHHRLPWNAPVKGETNLDDLVLVCPDCHHHVHGAQLTMVRNAAGTWTTRPATPDEIAPTHRNKGSDNEADRRSDRRSQNRSSGGPRRRRPAAVTATTTKSRPVQPSHPATARAARHDNPGLFTRPSSKASAPAATGKTDPDAAEPAA